MSVEKLKEEIEKREQQRLESKRSQYKPNNCIASGLGECLRERYHSIVDWDKKPIADTWLQARFEEGNEQERRILIKLLTSGFEVVEGQRRFEIKDRANRVIISGRIEGKIKYDGKLYPFEIKSMNPNIYAGIDTLEDFAKFAHTARYPKQLQSYMFSEGADEGFFILTDCLGHFKIIPIKLDYDLMEIEMKNCELVMLAVDSKEPLPFHKNKAICRKCWACKTCCFPPLDFGEGVQIVEDDELLVDLKRRQELVSTAKEFDVLDKSIKERIKSNYKHIVIDNYEVEVKEYPIKYKAQEARTITAKKVEISIINEDTTIEIA